MDLNFYEIHTNHNRLFDANYGKLPSLAILKD